jgi:spermidine/putrescine transport system permease protein
MSANLTVDTSTRIHPAREVPRPERKAERRRGFLIGTPTVLWLTFWLFTPYVFLLLLSLWKVNPLSSYLPVVHVWNIHNYINIFTDSAYIKTLMRSVLVGLGATAIATLLGFPVAYVLAFKVKRHKAIFYMLVIVPLWVSYLVRAYAWKVILGDYGVLNTVLERLGLIDAPLHLLYTRFAVIVTLAHVFTPFMILTIYTTLERIPPSLLEASYDLGLASWTTFRRITLPLAVPGILAGAVFTLGLSAGDFVAPSLVGGPSDVMISQLIYTEFGAVNNRPFAAAIGFVLLLFVMVLVFLSSTLEKREQLESN